MSVALKLSPTLRIVQRRSVRLHRSVLLTRPSLLDTYWRGDWWIEAHQAGLFALCINQQPLSGIALSPLDSFSANDRLFRLRHRAPRRSK